MGRIFTLVVAGWLLGAGAPGRVAAAASPAAEAAPHAERAQRLYQARRFGEAAVEFDTAYRLSKDPSHLYNLAHCYRLSDKPDEAIKTYQYYLTLVPDAPHRSDIEKRIADLKKQIAAAAPPPAPPPPVPPPVAVPPSAPAPVAAPPPAPAPPPVIAPAPAPAPVEVAPVVAPSAGPVPSQGPVYGPAAPPPEYPAPPGYPPPGQPQPGYPGAPIYGVVPGRYGAMPVPPVHPPTAHRHDGLFVRVQGGFGYQIINIDSDNDISGPSRHLSAQLGVSLSDSLVIFGDVYDGTMSNPTLKVGGVSMGDVPVTAGIFGVGGGLAVFSNPGNSYTSITVSANKFSFQSDAAFGATSNSTDYGPGATLEFGKEWWLTDNLSLGGALQFHYSVMKEKSAAKTEWTAQWLALLLSATYN